MQGHEAPIWPYTVISIYSVFIYDYNFLLLQITYIPLGNISKLFTFLHYALYTLKRNSSLHRISSYKHAIQLYKDSSTLTQMMIYSEVSCFFWEWYNIINMEIWIALLIYCIIGEPQK